MEVVSKTTFLFIFLLSVHVTHPQLKTLPIGEDFMFYERVDCEMQQLSRKDIIFKSFNIYEDIITFKW